jgi:endonuclease/exonuclease/phosphatase family metal-dependent hydrolase
LLSSACVRWTPPAVAPVETGSCRAARAQWLAPDDPRERTRLDSWCAGVGQPVIRERANAAAGGTTDMASVTFVSWNVHVGRGNMRAFIDDLSNGTLTSGRPVTDYVLMLQEVVRTGDVPPLAGDAAGAPRIAPPAPARATDVVEFAQELGLSLVYVPSMRNGNSPSDPAEDRGSAILSTLPLSNPMAIELPGERQRRVVILATAGSFSVGAVHLDALGGARRLRVFWTTWMREVQVGSLRQALPDGPLVLGADLNTWHGRDESAVRSLGEAFAGTRVMVERHGLGLRVLDYLFVRAPGDRTVTYREIENKYGSDHRPLVGWIE